MASFRKEILGQIERIDTDYQVRRNGEADADGSGGAGRRCGGCDGWVDATWLSKAVVKAKESLPQVNFDIYGTGAEEAKLKAIIELLDTFVQKIGHDKGNGNLKHDF